MSRTAFQMGLYDLGDRRAAEVLGVKRRTVKSWRLGLRMPRPAVARAITERSPVSLADIYGAPIERCPVHAE